MRATLPHTTFRLPAAAILAVALVAGLTPLGAAERPLRAEGRPIVRTAVAHDVSSPLRAVSAASAVPPVIIETGAREIPTGVFEEQPAASVADPVVQRSAARAAAPGPALTFEGLSSADTTEHAFSGLLAVAPPDPTGAAGPNHYFQWVNVVFGIFDKTGTLVFGPAPGNTLFAGLNSVCETSNAGDPIVLYDSLAGRFVVSQFAFPVPFSGIGPSYECVAVSQTSDPTGAWNRYAFLIDPVLFDDYPKMGVWGDAYYTTFNMFASSFVGVRVCAFERDQMLAGAEARQVCFDAPSTQWRSLLPADADGATPPTGAPNYLLGMEDPSRGFPCCALGLWEFAVDWSDPSASTFERTAGLATAPFDSNLCNFSRNCIPQPDTDTGLDALSSRLMFRLQYRNFGTHEAMVVSHTVNVGEGVAGVRWYELRKTAGGWSILQQGTFSPDATNRWMPSAAMDKAGDIAVGYSASSDVVYPGIRYAGRVPHDRRGTLGQGESILFDGTGSQLSPNRWGDYTHMSIDPVDGCTFWYTNEYYEQTGDFDWHTRVGAFKFRRCR